MFKSCNQSFRPGPGSIKNRRAQSGRPEIIIVNEHNSLITKADSSREEFIRRLSEIYRHDCPDKFEPTHAAPVSVTGQHGLALKIVRHRHPCAAQSVV